MTASHRFGRSMMPVRSVELLSCLTRLVTEAESSSSVEKRTPRMLFFNFGNRSKSRGSCRGFRADGVAPPSCICPNYSRTSLPSFPASLVCSCASYTSVFAKIDSSRLQLQSYHLVCCLSVRMCNFFTCHSAVFLQDLEHTFHTLFISWHSGSS